jgi:hypothetical protein
MNAGRRTGAVAGAVACASLSFAAGYTLGQGDKWPPWATATVWGMGLVYLVGFLSKGWPS